MTNKSVSLPLALVLGWVLIGCQGSSKSQEKPSAEPSGAADAKPGAKPVAAVAATKAPAAAEAPKQTCRPKTFSFVVNTGFGAKRVQKHKTMTFVYDGAGKLTSAVGTEKGSETRETASYTYDDKGRLAVSEVAKSKENQNKGLKATFVYADDGKLTQVKGEGALMTRTFEYDDKGRIAKQITLYGGKPVTTSTFDYDASGAPVKASMLNRKGELQMGFELTYDDKVNPFVGTVFANINGLILGQPIGAHGHNIVTRKTVRPKTPEAGKVDTIKYTYNDAGYPLTITVSDKGKDNTSTLTYDCK